MIDELKRKIRIWIDEHAKTVNRLLGELNLSRKELNLKLFRQETEDLPPALLRELHYLHATIRVANVLGYDFESKDQSEWEVHDFVSASVRMATKWAKKNPLLIKAMIEGRFLGPDDDYQDIGFHLWPENEQRSFHLIRLSINEQPEKRLDDGPAAA